MVDNAPLVSIISLCYNQAKYCQETLDGIYEQTYTNVEVILIDDCSTDNSVEVINTWISNHPNFNIQFLVHKTNQGICKSLNEALALTNGKYIAFCACDDVYTTNKIAHQVQLLNTAAEEIGLVCGNFMEIDKNSKIIKKSYFSTNFKFPKDLFHVITNGNSEGHITVHTPTIMVRAAVIKSVGGYDEQLIQEDLDLLLKLSFRCKFIYTSKILVKYRILSTSLSRNEDTLKYIYRDWFTVMDKYVDHPNSTIQQHVIDASLKTIFWYIQSAKNPDDWLFIENKIQQLHQRFNLTRIQEKKINNLTWTAYSVNTKKGLYFYSFNKPTSLLKRIIIRLRIPISPLRQIYRLIINKLNPKRIL